MLKVIKNENEYKEVMKEINCLIDLDPPVDSEEGDKLELLTLLAMTYENEHFKIDDPDPIEAIKFRMEQMNLSQKDLVPFIGTKSKVSEVLNKKRPLNLSMIRALSRGLNIPIESLVKEPVRVEPNNINSKNYPIAEMFKRSWFAFLTCNPVNPEKDTTRLIDELFNQAKLQPVMCRKKLRTKSTMNEYALSSWAAMVSVLAQQTSLPVKYNRNAVFKDIRKDLVKLSVFDEGPKLAKEYLNKKGIHLIILRHLKNTHLDGATMHLHDGTPVIALTLRYNRIDNFWFTLYHELAHLNLHLKEGTEDCFFDDLDADGDEAEKQADKYARDSFISPEYITKISDINTLSEVKAVANSLNIHPAIIAGRLHWERKNYRQFARFVGSQDVRKHFPEYSDM
jgi:HTH-type transcriptional regulator / antitoxin HigA